MRQGSVFISTTGVSSCRKQTVRCTSSDRSKVRCAIITIRTAFKRRLAPPRKLWALVPQCPQTIDSCPLLNHVHIDSRPLQQIDSFGNAGGKNERGPNRLRLGGGGGYGSGLSHSLSDDTTARLPPARTPGRPRAPTTVRRPRTENIHASLSPSPNPNRSRRLRAICTRRYRRRRGMRASPRTRPPLLPAAVVVAERGGRPSAPLAVGRTAPDIRPSRRSPNGRPRPSRGGWDGATTAPTRDDADAGTTATDLDRRRPHRPDRRHRERRRRGRRRDRDASPLPRRRRRRLRAAAPIPRSRRTSRSTTTRPGTIASPSPSRRRRACRGVSSIAARGTASISWGRRSGRRIRRRTTTTIPRNGPEMRHAGARRGTTSRGYASL